MNSDEEHSRYHRRLLYVALIIIFYLALGTAVYHYVEGWRYLDALYFSSYTMTTVGYGDFVPKTDIGKGFTVFYLFSSVSIAVYGLTLLATHFVESREQKWEQRISHIRENHAKDSLHKRVKAFVHRKHKD